MAAWPGIPRATWANLESGAANPTLAVLIKVAHALQVRLEELIEPPRRTGRLYAPPSCPRAARRRSRCASCCPRPSPAWRSSAWSCRRGAAMAGVPHTPGTREYLTCERGQIELSAGGESFALEPGDVVVFRGDQRARLPQHGGHAPTIAYSVIAFAPVG